MSTRKNAGDNGYQTAEDFANEGRGNDSNNGSDAPSSGNTLQNYTAPQDAEEHDDKLQSNNSGPSNSDNEGDTLNTDSNRAHWKDSGDSGWNDSGATFGPENGKDDDEKTDDVDINDHDNKDDKDDDAGNNIDESSTERQKDRQAYDNGSNVNN